MAHFYSNENFPLPVVEELRKLGHIEINFTGDIYSKPNFDLMKARTALADLYAPFASDLSAD